MSIFNSSIERSNKMHNKKRRKPHQMQMELGSCRNGTCTAWRRLGATSFPVGQVNFSNTEKSSFTPERGVTFSAADLYKLSRIMVQIEWEIKTKKGFRERAENVSNR